MCGILGGWTAAPVLDPALHDSLKQIIHRGPDDFGVFRDGPVFLGMRRLSIIDLEGGHQPIGNEDGSVVVVFNGEVYNYRVLVTDLRRHGHVFRTESDTEALVHLYEDEGTEMCRDLRGMYAFAIWDSRNRKLFLARDRFGKKPLYYSQTPDGGLIFASELKALRPLARATGTRWEVRPQGIYDYLSLGVVPQPETIFHDVHALPPGSWLSFDGTRVVVRSYWQLAFTPKVEMTYADAVEKTRDLVAEAVQLRLRSDVPLGVFLSGGVDSSVVAYEASRQIGNSLETFTVAMDRPELDESSMASRTAQALGVKNTVLPLEVSPLEDLMRLVKQYDQPYADSSAIPSLAVARLARRHVTVVLNGDGGDELFGGYRRHLAAHLAECCGWARSPLAALSGALGRLSPRRRSILGFSARFLRGLRLAGGARYLAWTTDMLRETDKRRYWLGERMRPTEEWIEAQTPPDLSILDVQLHHDIQINLLSDLLVKMDIATMAASVEGRSPLLDHKLAEFTAGLSGPVRMRRFRPKSLLRDAYRGCIPDEVLDGPERGFEVPLQSWLEGSLRDLVGDVLASPYARVRDYLNPGFVNDLLDKKVLAESNWAAMVYMLLALELWFRENV